MKEDEKSSNFVNNELTLNFKEMHNELASSNNEVATVLT